MLEKLQEVIDALHEISRLNSLLQEKYAVGSSEWHQCETIDDRIYDALAKLGE